MGLDLTLIKYSNKEEELDSQFLDSPSSTDNWKFMGEIEKDVLAHDAMIDECIAFRPKDIDVAILWVNSNMRGENVRESLILALERMKTEKDLYFKEC